MSWAMGLSLWIIVGLGAAWAWGEIARAQSKDRGWDETAARKRLIERRAKLQSREFR